MTPYDDPFIPDPRVRTIVFATIVTVLIIVGLTDIRLRTRSVAGRTISDFSVYWTASKALTEGAGLYDVSNPRGSRYIYPPLFAVLLMPFVPLGSQGAGVLWYFASVAMAFGCYFELARIVRAAGPDVQTPLPGWLALGPILAVALPGFSCLQGGQTGLLMLFALLLGLRLTLAPRGIADVFAAGIACAFAIAIKLTPALPVLALFALLLLARTRGDMPQPARRGLALLGGVLTGGALFVLVIPGVALGWRRNLEYLGEFIDRIVLHRLEMQADLASNQSPWQFLPRWAETAGIDRALAGQVVSVLAVAVLAALVAALWRLGQAGSALEIAAGFGLACAASLFVSPVSWAHHFVFLTPALLFVPLVLIRRDDVWHARLASVAPVIVTLLHYSLRRLIPAAAILGAGMMLWYGWMAVVCAVQRKTSGTQVRRDAGSGIFANR